MSDIKLTEATEYQSQSETEIETLDNVELPKYLKKKIDFHIMPFFMISYFLQFLDKTLLNYAAVMGITRYLKGNEYANLNTIFYASFLAFEPLAGFLIQKLPIARYLGVNMVLWGAVVSFHSATKSYAGLMIIRTLLGIFEASTGSCLIPIMGMWYTKAEQTRRTALWFGQVGVGYMVGALLSYAFQHVHSKTVENWQILFIFMGVLTAVLGILTIFFLPDNPQTCKFLTEEEKKMVVEHMRINQTGIEERTFKWYQVRELLFKDKQTWLLFLITALVMCVGGSLATFSSAIIKSFGFTSTQTALMQIPTGFVTLVSTLVFCYLPSYECIGEKALMIAFASILSMIGFILQLCLPDSNQAGKLVGVYLMATTGSLLSVIYAWSAVNTAGYTKRLSRNTVILIGMCLGNLVAPQHFRASDAPKYRKAKIALIIETGVCFILALILRYVVIFENKKRDREAAKLSQKDLHRDALYLDLTDIENRNFRYQW